MHRLAMVGGWEQEPVAPAAAPLAEWAFGDEINGEINIAPFAADIDFIAPRP
jgi:hypothetical protein